MGTRRSRTRRTAELGRRGARATDRPDAPRRIGGVEVVPHYDAYDDRDGPFWLTDGGGIGIQFVSFARDRWGIVHHTAPGPGGDRDIPQVAWDLIVGYRRRGYRTAATAARAAARLVGLLREATKPDSGLQVMAGDWKGWPRGHPDTDWRT